MKLFHKAMASLMMLMLIVLVKNLQIYAIGKSLKECVVLSEMPPTTAHPESPSMINGLISGGSVQLEEGGLKVVGDLQVGSLAREEIGSKLEDLAVTANANPLKKLQRSGRNCLQVCKPKLSEF